MELRGELVKLEGVMKQRIRPFQLKTWDQQLAEN